MVRLSNLALTPALSGLIMVTAFLLGAIVVRVFTVAERIEVRTHTIGETGGQGSLKQDALRQHTLDIGIADLRGTLP